MQKKGLITGVDGKERCFWVGNNSLYCTYHDKEWGKVVKDPYRLFEKICLEGFQAGLSWLTILTKRENFRSAFEGFDYNKIALYDENKVASLLQDKGIVRHQGKICSVINNAKRVLELEQTETQLSDYFWSFKPSEEERFDRVDYETLIAHPTTPASHRLSKDLKKRRWTFVGPTTCYSFMQAVGIVNDHIEGCFCREQ
ncbi:DNA-3-methyladenine glycosylase I [Bartonella tamiae]|uniref:DNA-3-methyladenine glycosylase I n=1 Tax=Bartonella tamiae Th239 TaxID=1094558 RepID=J1JYY8_9HYPH|nr:DNA-3-methyladenine glycosylase I [Bartonella tamiae]EJF90322.1 DNA-3-methyladenine glycosylase I [Bartonella tamiae Th239]EJF93737.1 DNA-3-methyladenine glycosylase I [Bartonella tamiae Th307]